MNLSFLPFPNPQSYLKETNGRIFYLFCSNHLSSKSDNSNIGLFPEIKAVNTRGFFLYFCHPSGFSLYLNGALTL